MRRSMWSVGLVALVVVVGVLAWFLWPRPSTPWEEAVDRLPASVLKVSFTDWSEVGSALDAPADPSAEQVDELLRRGFDTGLTVTSALSEQFAALEENWGITPLDAEWEAYGQAREGSVDLLKLSSDVDLEELEGRFEGLGYQPPSGGVGEQGVWVGTPDQVAGLDEPFTQLQENVAVVADERLLVMGDEPAYVEEAVAAVTGDGSSLASADGVSALVSAAGTPSVAFLWAGDFACEDLAMSQADPGEAARGDSLVSSAGGVNPLAGMVMAQQAGGSSDVRIGMVFASSAQAEEDLQPRTDLASGDAVGQGGTFPERFEVVDATAQDEVITLELDPVEGASLLGDLGQGPVLFATC